MRTSCKGKGAGKLFPSLILSHHRFYGLTLHSSFPSKFFHQQTWEREKDRKSVNYSLLYEKWQEINVSMIIIIPYSALRMPSQIGNFLLRVSSHWYADAIALYTSFWTNVTRTTTKCYSNIKKAFKLTSTLEYVWLFFMVN
jgi:hypothetical protein